MRTVSRRDQIAAPLTEEVTALSAGGHCHQEARREEWKWACVEVSPGERPRLSKPLSNDRRPRQPLKVLTPPPHKGPLFNSCSNLTFSDTETGVWHFETQGIM